MFYIPLALYIPCLIIGLGLVYFALFLALAWGWENTPHPFEWKHPFIPKQTQRAPTHGVNLQQDINLPNASLPDVNLPETGQLDSGLQNTGLQDTNLQNTNLQNINLQDTNHQDPGLSIVVCVHNETQTTINQLTRQLLCQSYPLFEIIFVDDHSNTDCHKHLEHQANEHKLITLITVKDPKTHGKKHALSLGVKAAKYPFLLLTDADCIPTPFWASMMMSHQQAGNYDLVLGGVVYPKTKHWFQSLEFSALMATTAGAAYYAPLMSNGANMLTKTSLWLEKQDQLNAEILSGDDMFYLQALKKDQRPIAFLKNELAFITTYPKPSFKALLAQRQRWSGKTSHYNDPHAIFLALIVLLISVFIVLSLVCGFFKLALLLYIFKLSGDLILTLPFLWFSHQNYLIKYLLPFSIIYPFYVIFIALLNLFSPRKKVW